LITKLALDRKIRILENFRELEALDLAEIRVFDGVGTEMFAYHAWKFADELDPRSNRWTLLVRVS
jgi:hypothetical protein